MAFAVSGEVVGEEGRAKHTSQAHFYYYYLTDAVCFSPARTKAGGDSSALLGSVDARVHTGRSTYSQNVRERYCIFCSPLPPGFFDDLTYDRSSDIFILSPLPSPPPLGPPKPTLLIIESPTRLIFARSYADFRCNVRFRRVSVDGDRETRESFNLSG